MSFIDFMPLKFIKTTQKWLIRWFLLDVVINKMLIKIPNLSCIHSKMLLFSNVLGSSYK